MKWVMCQRSTGALYARLCDYRLQLLPLTTLHQSYQSAKPSASMASTIKQCLSAFVSLISRS